MRRWLAILPLLAASAALGAEQIVWQIGKPDRSYAEFAFAADYQAYARSWGARPVVFQVGRSDAARDWPFLQPGPIDHWTPAAGRAWTIRFHLAGEPRGVFTLRIEFADVHKLSPPLYSVSIAGTTGTFQLAPGGGDASLGNPRRGKAQKLELPLPAGLVKKGANEIRLACTEGSWVQYDAITLLADPEGSLRPGEIQGVTARPTPFFLRRDGQLRRAVDVVVATTGAAGEVRLRVEGAGPTQEIPVKQPPAFGSIIEEIGVPDAPGPIDVKITALSGSRSKSTTVRVLPQRKWRVYVAASSHTDIGYTDIQPKCAERHNENIDRALDLLGKYPQFCWNLEVAWQAENYVNSRTGPRLDDFYRFARQGKLGIQALYCNILTGLCSTEAACRWTWFAHRLCREKGLPYKSAMISDVPSQEASLPMILASAGIRYFSSGINNDRAYPFTVMQNRCPCWWEGPDGSRVLMMYTFQYAQAAQWALNKSLPAARSRVMQKLAAYEDRPDYPYDAVFLHGAVSDNCPLDVHLAEVVQQWNERYEYPKLILSTNAEFFEYIEQHFAGKLPVYRGSAGTYWEDGAGSSAHETKLCRNAEARLCCAQALAALADRVAPAGKYPADVIDKAWRNCLLYDEHTWGAHCSISQPDSPFTADQWKIKGQYARDAAWQTETLLKQAHNTLAGLVRTDAQSLVVFNPSSWPRTDTLWVNLPKGLGIIEPGVTSLNTERGTSVVVKDVPACGYRVLKLGPASPKPVANPPTSAGNLIENRFYRVEFDPATGGIVSIRDKELGRELVDRKAQFQLNQYVYVAGGSNKTRIVMNPRAPAPELKLTAPTKATLEQRKSPGIGEVMVVNTSGTMAPRVTSIVLAWDDVKRIDFVNIVDKQQTYDKEAVYFAFPFAAEKPTFRYEIPAGIVNANQDMLPGACLDWFTVQHFVEISGPGATIAWATPDAPLACFQDINRGKWLTALPLTNGHLYAYVMNNYWHTNYKAGQGGIHMFRFALTSRPKADNVESARFGWAASNPLLGVVVPANPQGPLPTAPTSLVSVAEPNVLITAVKRADDGQALVVRLWELSGRSLTAHLRLDPHLRATRAGACNLVEDPSGPLELRDGQVSVPIRGSGLATVRIQ
jgi:hypothetical protein